MFTRRSLALIAARLCNTGSNLKLNDVLCLYNYFFPLRAAEFSFNVEIII